MKKLDLIQQPLAELINETQVIVSMPDKVEIELVQANELRHYELFQWLVAIMAPIAIGFLTAYFTTGNNPSLLWSAIAFGLITIVFIFLAVKFRKKVFHGSIKKCSKLSEFKD